MRAQILPIAIIIVVIAAVLWVRRPSAVMDHHNFCRLVVVLSAVSLVMDETAIRRKMVPSPGQNSEPKTGYEMRAVISMFLSFEVQFGGRE